MISHAMDKVTQYYVKATASDILSIGSGNSGTVIPIIGAPLFGIYSYRSGPLTNTGDPQGYIGGKLSTDYTTIIKNTTPDSLLYNGPSRPAVFGSLRNTFVYRQFSLSFNIVYKFNYYFRRVSMSDVSSIATGSQGNEDYLNRWQKPSDELSTTVPNMLYPPFNSNRQTFYNNSSALIDKGDNIRLQDISISYDVNKAQLKSFPFDHVQLYLYVNNIGILWRANKDGLDPDLFSGSLNAIPLPKSFSIGLRANF